MLETPKLCALEFFTDNPASHTFPFPPVEDSFPGLEFSIVLHRVSLSISFTLIGFYCPSLSLLLTLPLHKHSSSVLRFSVPSLIWPA